MSRYIFILTLNTYKIEHGRDIEISFKNDFFYVNYGYILETYITSSINNKDKLIYCPAQSL